MTENCNKKKQTRWYLSVLLGSVPQTSHSNSGAVSRVEDLYNSLPKTLDHLSSFSRTAVSNEFSHQSVEKTVIENSFGDDGLDGGTHEFKEWFFLFRKFSQSWRKCCHTCVLKQLEFGSVKFLTQQGSLSGIGPVVVSCLNYFGCDL